MSNHKDLGKSFASGHRLLAAAGRGPRGPAVIAILQRGAGTSSSFSYSHCSEDISVWDTPRDYTAAKHSSNFSLVFSCIAENTTQYFFLLKTLPPTKLTSWKIFFFSWRWSFFPRSGFEISPRRIAYRALARAGFGVEIFHHRFCYFLFSSHKGGMMQLGFIEPDEGSVCCVWNLLCAAYHQRGRRSRTPWQEHWEPE